MVSNTPSTPAPCKGTVKWSFLFNSVRVKYVATCPETGISFYVNNGQGGVIGVRVYPDGRKVLENATTTTSQNSKIDYDAKRKQRYLQFKSAFGKDKHFLVSHAVYIAWRGKPIPKGMTIDHIDGCTTNNDFRNLRCIDGKTNIRDGGCLTKLRNQGINPTTIQRWMLLRYYTRMANIKTIVTSYRYEHLTKDELLMILYDSNREVIKHFRTFYNIHISFPHVPST